MSDMVIPCHRWSLYTKPHTAQQSQLVKVKVEVRANVNAKAHVQVQHRNHGHDQISIHGKLGRSASCRRPVRGGRGTGNPARIVLACNRTTAYAH